jgi:hypothetical protein
MAATALIGFDPGAIDAAVVAANSMLHKMTMVRSVVFMITSP